MDSRPPKIERGAASAEIFLSDPVLTSDEIEALGEVIQSGWITMGERVYEFERRFAAAHGAADAIAVASCTAALHLILRALDIGPGDQVLVPSLTFAATASSVCYTGAVPVFVDVESLSRPHMDVSDAEKKVTTGTKAVIVMHYGGWLCGMEDWRAFADKHRLALIEDAAHAPGHSRVGKCSDATAFSFYGNKNMTTAEGGMILVGDKDIAAQVRRLRSHGMTTLTLDRRAGHAYSYDVTDLGYNYRMDELRAAVGLVQLGKLEQWKKTRTRLLDRYRAMIGERAGSVGIPFRAGEETTAHLCPVVLEAASDRERIMRKLRERGIHSSNHYPPVHKFTYYQRMFGRNDLPVTEEFSSREISLPIHPGLTLTDVDYVVEKLSEVL